MTETDHSWGPAGGGVPPWRRATVLAGAAVATVVLAMVGGISGWMLAGASEDDLAGPVEVSEASPTSAPSTKAPDGPAPGGTRGGPTQKKPPAGSLVVPDLVGLDFEDARQELRRRNLGWHLVFRDSGDSRIVEASDPPAGQAVGPGVTVRVVVAGAAPAVEVPDVTGRSCAKAADRLVDAGLYPEYPEARSGEVHQQEPEAGTELQWNDRVRIYCGKKQPPGDEPSTPY